jgi:hypothetical protein
MKDIRYSLGTDSKNAAVYFPRIQKPNPLQNNKIETFAACGAIAASFYIGACIGSVLVAGYETLDVFDICKIVSWIKEVEKSIGETIDKFIEKVIASNSQLSRMKRSVILAKK